MKDQPWYLNSNLASRSEVVSIYKCSKKFWGPSPNLGCKNILTTYFATSALDTAYLRSEMSHRRTKMLVSIYNVSPKSWPTFRDLCPRNSRLIVTHPMKIQHFPSLLGFPHKGHWIQANQILPDARGLWVLTFHHKNFRKIRPKKNFAPSLNRLLANTFLWLAHSKPHISGTKRRIDNTKY